MVYYHWAVIYVCLMLAFALSATQLGAAEFSVLLLLSTAISIVLCSNSCATFGFIWCEVGFSYSVNSVVGMCVCDIDLCAGDGKLNLPDFSWLIFSARCGGLFGRCIDEFSG